MECLHGCQHYPCPGSPYLVFRFQGQGPPDCHNRPRVARSLVPPATPAGKANRAFLVVEVVFFLEALIPVEVEVVFLSLIPVAVEVEVEVEVEANRLGLQ